MLERFGIKDRYDLVTFFSLILLVALTPTGKEATDPVVFVLYRTLLLVIIASYFAWADRSRLPRLSPAFLMGVTAVAGLTLVSILRWQGDLFESFYLFYENILFVGAFIALAHSAVARSSVWKNTVLGAVVLIDFAYIASSLVIGTRPLIGPFVNPNYLASFVLPGLAICAATVLLSSSTRLRITAAGIGLFLYYGIGQTASRGATLAGLALLGLAGFRAARRRGFPLVRIALVASLLIAITLAFNPALIRKFLDRGEQDPYNYQRTGIWMGTLQVIGQHPVTGVGLGHFSYIAKLFTPAVVENTVAHYRRFPNIAHSEYLQYMAEIGVPGALLLFGLGGYLLMLAWRRAADTPPENGIAQESALLAAAGLGVHALVDNNWTVPVMAAGLAVISQADLLPYRKEGARPDLSSWRHAIALLLVGVWLDAAIIPSIGLYFNERGHQAHAADDFERAEVNHRFALAVIPRHPGLLDNLGLVYLDEFIKTKNPNYLDRAEFLFSDSMVENPHFDMPAGHLETALMQRLSGDPQRDRPIHKRIIETEQHFLRANPFNPFIRKNLAEAYYNIGDRDQACEELLKAIAQEPNYVAAYLRLADWYEEAGRTKESARYRNQAIQVVNYYKDSTTTDPFDLLLLGRPRTPKQP